MSSMNSYRRKSSTTKILWVVLAPVRVAPFLIVIATLLLEISFCNVVAFSNHNNHHDNNNNKDDNVNKEQRSIVFLAKSPETFKFSDLQLLEAQLQAKARENAYQCQRLVLDSATGSNIYQFSFSKDLAMAMAEELFTTEARMKTTTNTPRQSASSNDKIQSSLSRCEWVAEVYSHGNTAGDLVNSLVAQQGIQIPNCTGWTIEYIRMNPTTSTSSHDIPRDLGYTLKTLLCSVAPHIRAPPALDPKEASHHLMLLETVEHGLFLGRSVFRGDTLTTNFSKEWAQRPFHYSSAIHQTVADILVDLLVDLVLSGEKKSVGNGGAIRLLDPTCGSGTFLAFALAKRNDMIVEGWDINPHCVEGARRNLEHLFGKQTVEKRCKLYNGDSASLHGKEDSGAIDCVTANLPWGKNTIDYVDQNKQILETLRSRLQDGVPCAFVHKDDTLSSKSAMLLLGFEILGEAYVPPQGFALPKPKKKAKQRVNVDSDDGASPVAIPGNNQRVTIVRTIPQH